jgi:6-phosphogluconolactonase
MELVGAPVTELKSLITGSFEDWSREPRADSPEPATDTRSCALTGGATAIIFLSALGNANVDWRTITLFWGDERAVPPDDPESNYGLAERMLLSPLGAKAPRAIRMPLDAPPGARAEWLTRDRPLDAPPGARAEWLTRDRPAAWSLQHAALWYDDALETELDGGVLDLAILGVGEDGHVCSLFPGHPALAQNDHRAVAIEDAPKPPKRRLSLTMRYVLQTKKIWLIAIGPRKLPVLQAAINKTSHSTPLDLVLRQAKDVTIFTDQSIRR